MWGASESSPVLSSSASAVDLLSGAVQASSHHFFRLSGAVQASSHHFFRHTTVDLYTTSPPSPPATERHDTPRMRTLPTNTTGLT